MNKKLLKDIAERTAWTAVEAGAGFLLLHLTGLPPGYTPAAASILAAIKGYAASHIGDDTSAAAMPGSAK